MTDSGNAAQTRVVAEQVADAAVTRFAAQHPELRQKVEVPPPLKWAAAIIAALFTVGVAGMAIWLVSTVSDVQVTLARMDERQISQSSSQDDRYADHERRIQQLEAAQQKGAIQ